MDKRLKTIYYSIQKFPLLRIKHFFTYARCFFEENFTKIWKRKWKFNSFSFHVQAEAKISKKLNKNKCTKRLLFLNQAGKVTTLHRQRVGGVSLNFIAFLNASASKKHFCTSLKNKKKQSITFSDLFWHFFFKTLTVLFTVLSLCIKICFS